MEWHQHVCIKPRLRCLGLNLGPVGSDCDDVPESGVAEQLELCRDGEAMRLVGPFDEREVKSLLLFGKVGHPVELREDLSFDAAV